MDSAVLLTFDTNKKEEEKNYALPDCMLQVTAACAAAPENPSEASSALTAAALVTGSQTAKGRDSGTRRCEQALCAQPPTITAQVSILATGAWGRGVGRKMKKNVKQKA